MVSGTITVITIRAAAYRRMTSDELSWLAAEMSARERAFALEGIRRRHPDYDEHQARMALHRVLLGDELFQKVRPGEPLLAS